MIFKQRGQKTHCLRCFFGKKFVKTNGLSEELL